MMLPGYGKAYEWLFRQYLYPLYEERLRRRDTLQWMRALNERDQWSGEELRRYQLAKLKVLLRHAADHVPWYREQVRHTGLIPEDMTDVGQINVLPVLTKEMVRQNYDALIAENYQGKTFSKVTGGSTGAPFQFEITRQDYERRMAVMWRGYSRAGARLGRRTLYLWGADILPGRSLAAFKDRLYHAFFQRRMLNSFKMTEANRRDYFEAIRRYRPEVIVSYVGPLYQLAVYMLEQKLILPAPASILTGAEPLHEFQRQAIEQAFSAPVFNTYGCREVMLIASECPGVEGMLVNADQLLVEAVDEQGRSQYGQPGQLLLTDLHAFGMPLIRYQNGDLVTLASPAASEPADYPWPRLLAVQGRKLDIIRTVDGGLLPGEFFPHLMKDIPGVRQFQVIQKRLESLAIKLVVTDQFNQQAHALLSKTLRSHLGENMRIDIETVAAIALTPSGKYRVTISEIGNQ